MKILSGDCPAEDRSKTGGNYLSPDGDLTLNLPCVPKAVEDTPTLRATLESKCPPDSIVQHCLGHQSERSKALIRKCYHCLHSAWEMRVRWSIAAWNRIGRIANGNSA
ncbi:MAG: hypothetical protein R3C17_08540 [Planctomycetaceae bacterium]